MIRVLGCIFEQRPQVGGSGGRYKNYAQDIRNSGAHLLALINDVLDLSRLDAAQTELAVEDSTSCG